MTVGIPDFEIKIMVFRVMRLCTFVGGYQHFEGNTVAGSIFIFYPAVEAARFFPNIGRHL